MKEEPVRPWPAVLPAAVLPAAVLLAAVLATAACGSGDWSQSRPMPTAIGALGAGFTDPASPPGPEATFTPAPGSWDEVRPSKGFRVVLLTAGDDAPTRALVSAVESWASAEDVDLRTVDGTGEHDLVPRITEAIGMNGDLVISAGNALIDPLTLVSASHLDQEFLVIGAETGEPTANVTAVDWTGAAYRGAELQASSEFDPATFTAERCGDAVRAGVASVLSGVTGVVLWLA
ncbi:type 1 periplasmic-binding domain-containing protein [Kineosporia succinea]|uniref:BMP family ABC transporter substrate-binding protein n=1 Tax=Kineosporia succinea TaxID=84632 RepID=A0ABT9P062_9ACTN|nr:hypothetical protein [Kineosporia succinea]MDP9825809.1 hypothetical protein [Kineosporia succinea]